MTSKTLASTQQGLFRNYRALLDGQGRDADTHALRTREVQQFNPFSHALAAARTDSYEVWEMRRQWQSIESRSEDLRGARANPQAELLVREMITDVRAWRDKVQEAFQGLSVDPAAAPADVLRERPTARLERLEGRIEETLDQAAEGELSDRDGESFNRLLGTYRGPSEAVIAYVGTAEGLAWGMWRESRF